MAVITHGFARKGLHLAAPAALFEIARERFNTYRRYRRTLNELAQLTDRELADLGLHRSGLKAVALEAARNDR